MSIMSPEETLAFEKRAFLEKVKDGVPRVHAAMELGWSLRKLERLLREQDFLEMVTDVEQYEIAEVEMVLRDKAKAGAMDAIKMYLLNKAPERWSERREVNVTGTSAVIVAHVDATRSALRELLEDPSARDAAIAALMPGGVIDAEVIEDDDST